MLYSAGGLILSVLLSGPVQEQTKPEAMTPPKTATANGGQVLPSSTPEAVSAHAPKLPIVLLGAAPAYVDPRTGAWQQHAIPPLYTVADEPTNSAAVAPSGEACLHPGLFDRMFHRSCGRTR